MTWTRLDDSHQDHPKIIGLSDKAYRLWVRVIGFSNRFRLDGDLTLAQLRHVRGPIAARRRHERELIAAKLWHETDTGIHIHDIEDYQPKGATTAELSEKRRKAGLKGAQARWQREKQSDSNLPLAKNAPVPSRPVPSRPSDDYHHHVAIDLKQFGSKLAEAGICLQISSTERERFSRLVPVYDWEIEEAITKTNGKRVNRAAYLLSIIENARQDLDELKQQPPPPAAKQKQPTTRAPAWVEWEPPPDER